MPCVATSDHYPVCFTRTLSKKQIKKRSHLSIKYRCFKKFNEDKFLADLSLVLSSLQFSTDTNTNFDIWIKSFLSVLDKHAPIKSKRVKRETQPDWYNEDIKTASSKRDMFHKLKNWSQYKYWRNKTNKLIQNSKKDFFSNAVQDNKSSSFLWKHVKQISSTSESSKLPEELNIDNESFNTPSDIANKLNSYFANISDRLKASHSSNPLVECDLQKLNDFIKTRIPDNTFFKIPLIDIATLTTSIKSLDINKATGLDGLSPKMLKLSAEVVAPSLVHLINISILEGKFPDILKVAKLNPIHKNGPKNEPSNYRPISILPIISKIIEKHITKHLFGYLNKYKLLHRAQSGFRQRHSCNTALINLVDKWLNSIDKGDIVGAVFFDLKKAFDVVNHDILLRKLACYKFDNMTLNWISSYLTNRKQCIVEGNLKSETQTVKSGVPQGSVLGPILFILFINDLPLFTSETDVDIYADDTTLHSANKNIALLRSQLQNGASGFIDWCLSNDMYVNIPKTVYMTLGSRQNLSRIEQIELFLENEIIQNVKQQKLLGVIIDNTLSWDKQVDSVCINISRRISLLKLLSKYIDIPNMKLYYNSYILPIIDYGCLIWGRCTKINILRILKLQKRAARIILKADIMTPSNIMFKELNWLTFPQRVQYHSNTMVYKALNELAPEYISDIFIKVSDSHTRTLRSTDNDLLRIPSSKTNFFENSFTISASKLWNQLPLDIRNSPSQSAFKTSLKAHLLST